MERRLYLAAYDVSHERRLARALKVVRGFASGGQKSAYECWLTTTEWYALHRDIAHVIEPEQDRFALFPLAPRKPLVTLGVAEPPADPDFLYFG
ncbi:MAG: CRISPR-associated endonuclease Cas2 [Spiribacter salinus]|uniref:CRISPR-associated endoribonuclease Cas2 n=1 Tax=Spiribacter salinus TaxID=1335746 RepID=A0A540VN00_9GAMM|nr:MAG: CRISPR-associated endonuclease Cas2 [Spiribacter salinus]